LDDYYAARGWTSDGVPTVEKLEELELGEYAGIVKGGKA
jgi:aldehyde:ferredoxin oxidoreductase